MPDTLSNPERPASQFMPILRRRWKLILLIVSLVAVAALVSALSRQKVFAATSSVLLSNQNLASTLGAGSNSSSGVQVQADRVAQTQADVARTPEVARRALNASGTQGITPEDLLKDTDVTVRQNSDVLEIQVRNRQPATARRLANAYAAEFTRYRRQLDTAALRRARLSIQQTLTRLDRTSSGRNSALYRTLTENDQQLQTLEVLQTSNAAVVEQADEADQVQPRPFRSAALGLVAGLVVALAVAFLRDRLDTRFSRPEELADDLELALLGVVPEPAKGVPARFAVMLEEPGSAEAEYFRVLRTNLRFASLDSDPDILLVTSAVQAEGKSTTASNLAVAYARAGEKVALVDLDLRRPTLNRIFDVPTTPGLGDVALGNVTLQDALRHIDLGSTGGEDGSGHLVFLAAGTTPVSVGEFVTSEATGRVLRDLARTVDLVIVDTPPVLQFGDASALTPSVDGVVLVGRLDVIRRPMAHRVKRALDGTPAPVLGVVVTGTRRETSSYGYGYGYGYGGDRPSGDSSAD